MRRLSIRIVILSRGRPDSIITTKLFPEWVEVIVPESEKQLYESVIKNPILTTPDNIIGLGMLRNWCLDNLPERSIVMVDDDISKFYCLTGELTKAVKDPEEVVQIIINTCVMSRDAGCKVFGFNQTDIRKYKGYEPFNLKTWVGTIIGVNDRKYRFIDNKFKVDIDYCMQSLLVDRIVWVDTRYYASNKKDCNRGGNATFRTKEGFHDAIKKLKDKWGDCLLVKNHKNQVNMSFNFDRKQSLTL